MPFTPFHFGPGLLVGLLTLRWLDFPTILIASVLVDIRATFVFFDVIEGALHGPLHTLLGATLLSAILVGVMIPLRPTLDTVLVQLRIPQAASASRIMAGGIVGTWLHIILDAILYADMSPLAPLSGNPALGVVSVGTVYLCCIIAGVTGVGLYMLSAVGLVDLSTPDIV